MKIRSHYKDSFYSNLHILEKGNPLKLKEQTITEL
jgi:hypothetical protein